MKKFFSPDKIKIKQMNRELLQISFYRGLLLSKYGIFLMLAGFYIYTAQHRAPASHVIYIVILSLIIPIITQAFFNKLPEKKETMHFAFLKKKYNYTMKNSRNQSAVLLVLYFLLLFWQRIYVPEYQILRLYYYPTYILAAGILLRLLLTAGYFVYMKHMLGSGRLD